MKVTVSGSYRYSTKVDPTDRDSAWHGSEVSFAIETDEAEALERREEIAADLIKNAKMQVFTNLNVEFDPDTLEPIMVVKNIPVVQTPRRKAQRQSKSAATIDVNELPRIEVDGTVFYDYRQVKVDGLVKPNFPDFKSDDFKQSYWLTDQEGQPTEFAKKLGELGLA